ncbi:MAG: carboxypeptidase regulatory-like domain-containing protein, partial [Bryobacteraceae bacterium]
MLAARFGLHLPILIAVAVFASTVTLAQIGGGSLVGVIQDPSSAPIPSAKVLAANLDTGRTDTAVANDLGYYEFPLLPAGRYIVRVKHEGFRPVESEQFTLNTGTRPRMDLTLPLGAISERVEITAEAPIVNATTTDLGIVMERAKIDALPLNGRNFQQLVGLQAGVLSSPAGQGSRGGMEFNGSPGLGNNLLLDGVDMSFGENNASASDTGAGGGGALINAVSVEALQEFKATGSAFAAEYGRATGGVLNLTTKSGTNQFHGTLFEFFRNDKLDANSFFSNRSGLAKPPLRWNQFGGNFGGPILKNRLFFFFNYEGAIVRRAQQIVGNVPTPLLLRQLTPGLRQAFSDTPTDFTATADPNIGLHRRNDRRTNDEQTTLTRVDYNLAKHHLAFRYSYNNQDVYTPALQLTKGTIFPMRFHNGVAQDGFTISPRAFNELRVGVNKVGLDRRNFTLNDPLLGGSSLDVSGTGFAANDQNHIGFFTNTYTVADNFTWISGKHTIKAGTEIRVVASTRDQQNNPTHGYRNIADLIADRNFQLTVRFSRSKGY